MQPNPRNALVGSNHTLAALLIAALLGTMAFNATSVIGDEKKEDAPKDIADWMGVINDNQKKLRRSARKKEFDDESIKLVAEMIEAAKVTRDMVPPMAEKIPQAEREKFIEGYKKEMDLLIAELNGLETALKEKRYDDAAKSIDKLNDLKKSGHDKYVEE